MIKYIQKNIELKKYLKKYIFKNKQNFRINTKNLNKVILFQILLNNIKKVSYLKKLCH